MRCFLWSCVALALSATALNAQGLRDKISQLFIFTAGQDPLFLGGTAGSDSATALHADHFIPSARAENGTLISFISNAISGNVANIPVSATSGGSTFRFEGGVPVRTSVSPGPVFAERAQALGRGRVFVGANVNRLHFETLRGVSLNAIDMTFTHVNVTGPLCDSIQGTSCDPYGVPAHENDVIALRRARPRHPVGAIRRIFATRQRGIPLPERRPPEQCRARHRRLRSPDGPLGDDGGRPGLGAAGRREQAAPARPRDLRRAVPADDRRHEPPQRAR